MESPLANFQGHYVDSIDEAYALKRWLGERRSYLGVDTESGGLRAERDRLRLIQFGDLDTGWVVPWERWGGVAEEILRTYEGPIVYHNSPHDVKFLEKNIPGWKNPWHNTHDTMTMAHLDDPTRPKGLKALAARKVDVRAVAGQKLLDDAMQRNGWTWDTVPLDHPFYWMYAALDPVLTCHVAEDLYPKIKATGAERAYDLEMAVLRIVTGMMQRGVRVDVPYCSAKARELREWVQRARTWLAGQYGVQNATSNQQVIRCLQEQGYTFTKYTPSGTAYALDKEVLESIDHPVAQTVLQIRKAEKICSAYLENFSEMVDPDGLIRATIQPMAARTGRMSVTSPALQTLHRGDPTVRDAFIPRPGHVLITCDADQIEARLAAHFAHDEGLINAFLSEGDFFCGIASEIFREPISKSDPRRTLTKNTVYGSIYGAGARKMAHTAGVPFEQMEPVKLAFDERYPGLKNLMRSVTNTAHARAVKEGIPYVRTPLGRRLPTTDEKEYKLVNYLIQGHAAEVLKQGLVNLDAAGIGDYLVLPVHDEVVADVPQEDAEEIKRTIEDTLTDLDTYAVPLTWSADVLTDRWGSKYRKG